VNGGGVSFFRRRARYFVARACGGGLAAISYIWYMSRQKAIMLEVALAIDELRLLVYQTDAIDRGAAYGSYEIGGPTGPVSAVCKGGQQGWPPCVDISIP
jgi:hypothetical protein